MWNPRLTQNIFSGKLFIRQPIFKLSSVSITDKGRRRGLREILLSFTLMQILFRFFSLPPSFFFSRQGPSPKSRAHMCNVALRALLARCGCSPPDAHMVGLLPSLKSTHWMHRGAYTIIATGRTGIELHRGQGCPQRCVPCVFKSFQFLWMLLSTSASQA